MDTIERPTIAIMLGDTQSRYSEDLLHGFYTCAKEEHVHVVFLMGPQMPSYCKELLSSGFSDYNYQFDTIYDYVHFAKPDALIIAYGSLSIFKNSQEKNLFLSNYKDIPLLLLEDIPDNPDIPYLIADNYDGMKQCMEHLVVRHKYRSIAYLSGPRNNQDAAERLHAYRDVMKQHHLPVTDTMIAYGDYSEIVTKQIEYLLDNNPGLEAIACANDSMARTCYQVCAARNLMVGHDIAITGFDDVDTSKSLEPPLTSVSHSSFQFSYNALQNALSLCRGHKPKSLRMPAAFHQRCSCGCPPNTNYMTLLTVEENDLQRHISEKLDFITQELFSSIPYERERIYYSGLIHSYFDYIYLSVFKHKGRSFSFDLLTHYLKELLAYPHFSSILLLEHISALLRTMITFSNDPATRALISNTIAFTQQYIHSFDIRALQAEIMDSNRKAWFVPSLTRNLINSAMPLKDTFYNIMTRLRLMDVKSTYFFLFQTPVSHFDGSPIAFPKYLHLYAYFTDSDTVYYPEEERPRISVKDGISRFFPQEQSHCYTSFVLFSEEEQYGLMLCEVAQKDISFMQICSLQLGSLFRFIQMNYTERIIQQELHDSMKVIQEQNRSLSFVSEYDDLTRLLNRRGFMERAMHAIEQNDGKKAFLLFGDLDHLKEINDSFGHVSGDFALRTVADRLKKCLPKSAITARIGGDEFISLIITDTPDFKQDAFTSIRQNGTRFNQRCSKPFYIEISIGIYEFCCSRTLDFADILQQSDSILYREKAKRRKSIRK